MANSPICLRAYRPGDEAAFTPRPDMARDMAANRHDWAKGLPPGYVWTLNRWGGEVVGVAGCCPLNGQTYTAWSCLADLNPREIAMCLRLARKIFKWMSAHHAAPCFIAMARVDSPGALRCLHKLGFTDTGLLHAERSIGVDYRLLSRGA